MINKHFGITLACKRCKSEEPMSHTAVGDPKVCSGHIKVFDPPLVDRVNKNHLHIILNTK